MTIDAMKPSHGAWCQSYEADESDEDDRPLDERDVSHLFVTKLINGR